MNIEEQKEQLLKATELRIGNYIYLNGLDEVKAIKQSRNGNYKVKLYYDETDSYEWAALTNTALMGIPLHKELLLALGFEKDVCGNFYIDLQTHCLELRETQGWYYPAYIEFPEFSSQDEQIVFLKRIKNLHEIQNLYFTLSGEELKLKYLWS